MEYYITQPKDYWIAANAVNITLNALGNANRLQCSVASGAVIMCFVDSIRAASAGGEAANGDGLWYGADHQPKKWPLTISPTYFNSDTHKYVYAAIPRSSSVGTQATIVFPSEEIDIYGRARRDASSSSSSSSSSSDEDDGYTYEQIGSTDYFYIFLQGIISAPSGDPAARSWEQAITDWGRLETALGIEEKINSGEWFTYNAATGLVTFLKNIIMQAGTTFRNLFLNGKELTDVATSGTTYTASDTLVATPGYIANQYLSKTRSDTAAGHITFTRGLWSKAESIFDGLISATAGILSDLVHSFDYTGETVYDSGWSISSRASGNYSKLTVDMLYVRVKALFESLEIKQRTVTGGDETWSGAANVIVDVQYFDSSDVAVDIDDTTMDYARCYFLAADADGNEVDNMWQVNDMVRCQTFNLSAQGRNIHTSINPASESGGTYTRAQNTFWWRKIVGVSSAAVTIGNKKFHYFDVQVRPASEGSSNTAWCAAGSDIPAAGDHASQFGNTADPERMNAVCIEINGAGNSDAPCIKAYRGIYTFDLTKCWWGGASTMKMKLSPATGFKFYGPLFEFVTEYGEERVPISRGAWSSITPETDDYDTTQQVRKCYYYDQVTHNGSLWLCVIADGFHWKDGDGAYITDAAYAALSDAEKVLCSHVRNYTSAEPSENSADWLKQVAKGSNGQSAYKSTMFCRNTGTPYKPSRFKGSYSDPSPSGCIANDSVSPVIYWSDGIPEGDLQLWAVTRIFTSDGESPQQPYWSDPRPLTDTETYDVEFSAVDTAPGNPTDNPSNWHDPSETGVDFTTMKWMAERSKKNGVWGSWTILRIKGEDGKGVSTVVRYYYASASATTPSYNASTWKTDISELATPWSETAKYLYAIEKTVWSDGSADTWGDVYLSSVWGADGADGYSIIVNPPQVIFEESYNASTGAATVNLSSITPTVQIKTGNSLQYLYYSGFTTSGCAANISRSGGTLTITITSVTSGVREGYVELTVFTVANSTSTTSDGRFSQTVKIPIFINRLGTLARTIVAGVETVFGEQPTYTIDGMGNAIKTSYNTAIETSAKGLRQQFTEQVERAGDYNRNLFGFHNGVKITDSTWPALPFVQGYGLVINTNYSNSSNSRRRTRLQNLGLKGVGGYFAVTFQVKLSAGYGYIDVDMCDVAPVLNKGSVGSTNSIYVYYYGWKTVTLYFYLPDDTQNMDGTYNGFLDIEDYDGTITSSGANIYIRHLKIERGTEPTAFCEADEDIAYIGQGNMITSLSRNSSVVYRELYGGIKDVYYLETTTIPYNWNISSMDYLYKNSAFSLKAGCIYTLSFWAKADVAGMKIHQFLYRSGYAFITSVSSGIYDGGSSGISIEGVMGDGETVIRLSTSWVQYFVRFYVATALSSASLIAVRVLRSDFTSPVSHNFYIGDIQLQEGYVMSETSFTSLIEQNARRISLLQQTGGKKAGLDLQNGVICATADNFFIQNNDGDTTFSVDEDGNLVTKGDASIGGTVKAKNLFHGVCIAGNEEYGWCGNNFMNAHVDDVYINNFEYGKYYTREEVAKLSGGDVADITDMIACTHGADLILVRNSSASLRGVVLPMPEDFQGKMVEIYDCANDSNAPVIDVRAAAADGDSGHSSSDTNRMALGISSNGAVSYTTSYLRINAGHRAKFYSYQSTNGTWYWLKIEESE